MTSATSNCELAAPHSELRHSHREPSLFFVTSQRAALLLRVLAKKAKGSFPQDGAAFSCWKRLRCVNSATFTSAASRNSRQSNHFRRQEKDFDRIVVVVVPDFTFCVPGMLKEVDAAVGPLSLASRMVFMVRYIRQAVSRLRLHSQRGK